MGHRHFEKTDNAERVEQVEKTDKVEGKEKENILNKVKNFFAEHGKNQEGKEQREDKEKGQEKKVDGNNEQKKNGWDLAELPPEEKKKTNENMQKIAAEYREKRGLNDTSEDDKSHGEDGERTRYSDMKAEQNKAKYENKEDDDYER